MIGTFRVLGDARLRFSGIVAAAALLASGLASCGGGGSHGDLRIGISSTVVDSLNPFVGQTSLSDMAYRVVYPYLLQYNANDKLATDWAKSYTVSKNGRTWSFTVPTGTKWSDGRPLTASDAAWTINTILKYEKGPAAGFSSYVINMKRAVVKSPTRVDIELSKPTATAGDGLANIPILPEHIWQQYASGYGAQLKTFQNDPPVGAGSFLVSSYTKNQDILFKRNPDFYGTPPKLSGFGFNFYSNNDALINAIKGNEIDLALDVPATTIKTLKSDSSLTVTSEPSYDVILLGINSNPKKTTDPELRDPTVRTAIALALDRQQINKTVTLGTGGVTPSILPRNNPYFDQSMKPPVYNLTKANRLLDGLGYTKGSDGIRVANGHPMSYSLFFCNCVTGAPLDVNLIINDAEQDRDQGKRPAVGLRGLHRGDNEGQLHAV